MLLLVQAARASLIRGPATRSASLRVGLVEGSATSARAAIHLGKTCCSTPGYEVFTEQGTQSVLMLCLLGSTFEDVPALTLKGWQIL